MRKTKKLRRKQPKRMTPPLVLRNEQGERSIVEVDDEITTTKTERTNRMLAFITIAPGITVKVGSRCVNKYRIPQLIISPGVPIAEPELGETDDAKQRAANVMPLVEALRAIMKGS